MSTGVAARGPRGGSENEQGGDFRADYAANLAAHGLRGLDIEISGDVRTHGRPVLIRAEVDEEVDDLEVVFDGGRRVLLQVKKSLELTISAGKPFRKVIDQWVQQVAASPDEGTPMVAVAALAADEIRHLAEALDRRRDRHASLPSPLEKKAITKLEEALRSQAPAVREAVLDRASIAIFPWHPRHGAPSVAVSMLDGNVVITGQGKDAFGELAKAHRKSASLRSGLDLHQWIDLLNGRFTLVTDGATSVAARQILEDKAVRRYSESFGSPGSIDLLSIGADLPPIEADVRCWVAAIGGEDKDVELDDFFRHHGRVILIGPPGSGKSTALRETAQREAHRGWCLPVLIDLRRLLQPMNSGREQLPILHLHGNPLGELTAMAVEAAEPEDRPVLIAAMRKAASEGRLLLCLDSLDETRKHRREVVSWIRRLTIALHADCDVLLATRSSAYAPAATLGWAGAQLRSPRTPRTIAEPIIRAVAQRDQHDSSWVGSRLRLVDEQLTYTPYLAETPLLVTALALELSASSRPAPKFGKAELMDSVAGRIAHDWERRSGRGGISMPDLPDRQIQMALSETLSIVGWQCVTSTGAPRESQLLAYLAKHFHSEQGLPQGAARVLAESCVDFWDEAGVLVRDDDGGLDARARNVVEASAARHLADAPLHAHPSLLGQAIPDPAMAHILTMAVELDPKILISAVEIVSSDTDLDVLLALVTGAQSRRDAPRGPVSELIARLSAIATSDGERTLEIVEAICRLPIQVAERSHVRELAHRLVPRQHLPAWEAMMAHCWDEPDALARCLDVAMFPPESESEAPHIDEDGVFNLGGPSPHDSPLSAALLGAAMRLPQGYPDAAVRLQDVAYERCDHRILDHVQVLLATAGYPTIDYSRKVNIDGMEDMFENIRKDREWLLERLSEVGAERPLKAVERRRLRNLNQVVRGLAYLDIEAGALRRAIRRDSVNLTRMIDFVVDCGGLDRKTLASEAIARMQEPGGDVSLACELPPCRLTCWDKIDIHGSITWLGTLFESSYLLARQGQLALAQAPIEYRPRVFELARTAAENKAATAQNRRLAALLTCYVDRDGAIDRWRDETDPVIRSSIMKALSGHPERRSIILAGIVDTDNLVTDEAVGALTEADLIDQNIIEALHHALIGKRSSTCRYCGLVDQAGEDRNCSRCNLALPNPRRKIKLKINNAAKEEL